MGNGVPDLIKHANLYLDRRIPVTPPEIQRKAAVVIAGYAHDSDELRLALEALGISRRAA